MNENKIHSMQLNTIYPLYVAKAEKKGRTQDEVNQIICWLTGYTQLELEDKIREGADFKNFFSSAPSPNQNRSLITGSICGIKITEIKDPIEREMRYLDKLIDELAKGKLIDAILRK